MVPVKPPSVGKSRLAAVGVHRPALAMAFALDTVTAALRCPGVAGVLAVCTDAEAGAELARAGARVLRGEPCGGLNAALAYGGRLAGRGPVATLSADLPALRPEELGAVLAAARPHRRAFLADAQRVGTTLLAARAGGAELAPAFGGHSRRAHAASGARELSVAAPSVRRDVDTPEDLREARALGVGPHTALLLEALVL